MPLLLRLLLLLAGFCASWNAPGSILEGFGWVLEPPGACFSRFLRAYVLALSERSECDKTTVLLDRNTCRKQRAQREKSQKIALGAFRTKLSVTVVPKTRLGPHQGRFWRRLGPSRACLGRVWGALRQVLGALGRLLRFRGSLGRVLDPLGRHYGVSWVHLASRGAPSIDFGRFGAVPG